MGGNAAQRCHGAQVESVQEGTFNVPVEVEEEAHSQIAEEAPQNASTIEVKSLGTILLSIMAGACIGCTSRSYLRWYVSLVTDQPVAVQTSVVCVGLYCATK